MFTLSKLKKHRITTGVKVKKTVVNGSTTKVKEYLDGFQYENQLLQFFPHSEGYVRVTTIGINPTNPQYDFKYAYNYTDHLGNVRLTYAKDPQTGNLKVMEENNYYPFGLKHKVYGSFLKQDYLKEEEINGGGDNRARPGLVIESPYNYKYQGQELQDELGLNWYSFKWRNYDYAIGRFMSIDPLAEKYAYNSTYAFQENKLGMGVELEGLELVHAEGNSPEFREKFAKTVKYMNEKGTSGKMAQLNQQSKTILVDNTGGGMSYYDPNTSELHWDSTLGVETTNDVLLSPATVLDHEIDHALQDKLHHEQFANDSDPVKSPDSNYENKEEKRVITGSEQDTARKHGEIQEGQVTRKDHYGQGMEMPDPTSTQDATPRDGLELAPVEIKGKTK